MPDTQPVPQPTATTVARVLSDDEIAELRFFHDRICQSCTTRHTCIERALMNMLDAADARADEAETRVHASRCADDDLAEQLAAERLAIQHVEEQRTYLHRQLDMARREADLAEAALVRSEAQRERLALLISDALRGVAFFDATRNALDKDAKRRALAALQKAQDILAEPAPTAAQQQTQGG